MAGHSHWAGIKHKKEIVDKKRGKEFSKLLKAVTAAAKTEPNPDFNPRLRTAVEKARAATVPNDKIEGAITRASESAENLEELLFEAYGPGGAAIMIEALSDSRNRTVQEIKKILGDNGGKWAESGSVSWAFDPVPSRGGSYEAGPALNNQGQEAAHHGNWMAKFPQALSPEDKAKLDGLVAALEENDDVQKVYTSAG